MPTIEFYGYGDTERENIERGVRDALVGEDFRGDCVFVEASRTRVLAWKGDERPFVRVSTRSPQRAERFKLLLCGLCDLEVTRIDFQPRADSLDEGRRSDDVVVDDTFEHRLIDGLQPVRGFALAQGIYHLFASGMFDRIAEGPATVDDVAAAAATEPARTAGFLRFLANEGIVSLRDDAVALTSRGHDLREFRPWYELLVGGYAQTFLQLTDALRSDTYADRNGLLVGVGSCGISRYDALPLVRGLMTALPRPPSEIVDLGCGDGQFLAELARDHPGVRAVGVDPYAPVDRSGETVSFRQASAVDHVRSLTAAPDGAGSRLFLAAFLLQEVLEQEGRDAVVRLVHDTVRDGSHLAVVEVDHRPADPSVMRHGLGLAYYNPYFLLHVLTEQRLETGTFWSELFAEAGAAVVERRVADPRVDSTGLEFGCLLTAADRGGRGC